MVIEYLDWMATVRHRAAETLRSYRCELEAFCEWVAPQSLLTVSAAQAEGFIVRPRARRARGNVGAPSTQRLGVAILRSFYQWVWERGYSPQHLMRSLHAPTVHNVDPKPMADEHWLRVWARADLTDSDRVALGLGFYCGLRRNEIYSLKVGNVTPTAIVEFRRKGGGTQSLPWSTMTEVIAEKIPHLMPDPMRFGRSLRDLVLGRDATEPLLLWPCLEESAFNKRLHRWCDLAIVPRHSPHQLRHSCATNLVRAGVPIPLVASMLNHSSTTMTMRYVKAGGRELTEWLERSR